jgi:hypothetical protein
VEDRRVRRPGDRPGQPVAHRAHERRGLLTGDQPPAFGPAGDLPLDEALGSTEVGEADRRRGHQVELRQRLDGGEAHAAADVRVRLHRGRYGVPDDLARAVLDHQEVGADHGVVVAEQQRPRGRGETSPQAGQRAVLAPHVVGARSHAPERRAPHHQAPRAEGDEVGEVGRAVGELEDPHLAVESRELLPQVGGQGAPVERLAGPDRRDLDPGLRRRHRASTVQALTPGAP